MIIRKVSIPNKANNINLVICEPEENNPSISSDKSAVYKETNNFQIVDCIGINAKHEKKNDAWCNIENSQKRINYL